MDHLQRFHRLTDLLLETRSWWQFVPFEQFSLPWRVRAPELCAWLSAQPDEALVALRQEASALHRRLSPYLPFVAEFASLVRLPACEPGRIDASSRLSSGVPGRKWQQITAFASALEETGLSWLEWCAGKGHLGRVLAAGSVRRVTSLEWQQALCQQGQSLALKAGLPQRFVQGDALGEVGAALLEREQHAVALHACGELHLELLRQGAARRTLALSLSPCCYHLIPQERYRPLSAAAGATALRLTKLDLKLPLQETVTAPPQVRRRRRRELGFRLGFDSLQRHQGGTGYLPLPTVPKSVLDQGFEAFCRWGCERKGLSLDLGRATEYLAEGEARVSLVEQMETVRQLFRRPLEIWLALDRVLFLQEQGYRVSLSEFCPRSATPRNLLIQARLAQAI
ncbi:methyltransferase [Ferrimonas sediminicola]|uniref:Methyltransferase n=1 Tax=Ferrimonas sediminicola TaxID=2569538 RepID=A0A4U1BDX2_9GAMM|nr:methyltransferase [Ferrimonas sediminicola]TKB49323.1 methyltransferase [Ferrimonas sediminicola]